MLTITATLYTLATLATLSLAQEQQESEAEVFQSITQCCSLGAERAESPLLGCDDIPVPIRDVVAELQVRVRLRP